ncbi:sensor histidine kinase [Sphingopyxis sp. JAI128]|uniref:sensor histidine kinase n=1 Tax=Sphingopyxis sp. JAI128 TaxID=2723066 RepID=UPI001615DFCC|nr:sensor histidine kinase [Sphingopyxis sp. JAI128]MBB6425179.1 signal transduction histidine kinase [Sphingopyxis sp. JAI128]
MAHLLPARRGVLMKFLYAILGLLVLLAAQAARAEAGQLPVLELRAHEDAPPLAPFVRFAKRPGETRAPQLTRILAGPLQRIEGPTIHFGPPGTRTVVLLKVRNASSEQGSWILSTGRGSLKHFRLYEAQGGRLSLIVDGTDSEAARRNLGTYQAFSQELVLAPRQEKLVAIEFVSENSTYMPLRIQSYGSFFKERRANISMVSGVVVGALILLLLNFLFFSITGFREFLWLAVAEAFFALNTVHSEGYITIFFLYDQPQTGVAVEDFIKCGFAASMAQFCRSFVNTQVNFPKRDMALKALVLFAVGVMLLQPGLAAYPAGMRFFLHLSGWLVAVAVALFLPFVGYAAMRQLGYQLWPLFVGWASLALFIIYAAIASMGVFTWLPINWHLAGPVGLFESVMVTLALGLNLKKIQQEKIAADANYARSLSERLEMSEQAKRLVEEKASALETVYSQNALLHASGHDSRQVILALNSAVDVLKRRDGAGADRGLVEMLESSASYLNEIVSTTISGANIATGDSGFVALSSFSGHALVEPLSMMFKTLFAGKKLSLDVRVEGDITIISDKPLLMRALANLLSNSYKFTQRGGASIALSLSGGQAAIVIRDSGSGMPAEVVAALNSGTETRIRADEKVQGTGSGFGSARRIIHRLHGTLQIESSTAEGTQIRILLPAAFATATPVSIEALRAQLKDWTLLDFDDRPSFEAGLAGVEGRVAALTYDDTTVTRGRLSELVDLVAIKPPCRELLAHPLFAADRSEQI